MRKVITGNYAAAYGAMLSRPAVVAAYPITPQTTIVELLAKFKAEGIADYKYIPVESEMAAISACMGAELSGVRAYTATSAHGLLLMHEMLHWVAGQRIPLVMNVANRALAPPWSVWADHQDAIAQRDTGWMQIFAENNQEVLDSVIMGYKIAESHDILLPMIINMDAFILTHTLEVVDIPDQEMVDEFLPSFDLPHKIDLDNPRQYGTLAFPNQYMEFRYKMAQAMERAKSKIKEVAEEFKKKFGRYHGDLLDIYRIDGADVVLITMGALSSMGKEAVDILREQGYNVGLIRLRTFRPFPTEDLRKYLKDVTVIGTIDRSYSFGYGGALFNEVKAALYGHSDVIVKDYIVGIGGRDISTETMIKIFKNAIEIKKEGKLDREIEWIDLNI
ncbi:MAG: transketolase C-terminal domain-containing protein [Candidatus Asgardarchaeum sp.]